MKLFKKIRKGFTLIELVVVIAVIAILSAVSVVSYITITNRAKQSADEQAVKQMNTVLQANEILAGKTIGEAIEVLREAGFDAKDYKPLSSGRYFFWDSAANRVVYAKYSTSGGYEVIYPEGFQREEGTQWFSLSNDVAKEAYVAPTISGATTTVSVDSGEQLAQLVSDLKDIANGKTNVISGSPLTTKSITDMANNLSGEIVVELDHDIDLGGSPFNINICDATFVLRGVGGNRKISGIANYEGFGTSTQNEEHVLSAYGAGIVGYATRSTIRFENITIADSYFGSKDVKASAVFVGMTTNCNVSFENTAIQNCTVEGSKGCAVYVGHYRNNGGASDKKIEFSGTNSVANTSVKAYGDGETRKESNLVGIISGRTTVDPGLSFTIVEAPTVNNVSLYNKDTKLGTIWYQRGNNASAEAVTTMGSSPVTVTKP